jgi:hypothetical protein
MSGSATHVFKPSLARRIVLDGFVPVPRGAAVAAPPPLSWPAKDPSDVLDYVLDVSAALVGNEGDGIASIAVTIAPNATGDLVMNSAAADGQTAVFWFAAGQVGTVYSVQVTITMQSGRTLGRALLLPVLALASTPPPSETLTTDAGTVITDAAGNPILLGG